MLDKPLNQLAWLRSFNRAAATYDRYSVVQRYVAQRQMERLAWLHLNPERIVDLGCGTGSSTQLLREKFPQAKIIGVDLAEQMLAIAKTKFQRDEQVKWLCADAMHVPLFPQSQDFIFSNLMLQWHNNISICFSEWLRLARAGGCLVLTTFGPATLQEIRASWAEVDGYTHVHSFLDIGKIGDSLMRAHWYDPVLETEIIRLEYTSLDDIFHDLKMIGAQNAAQDRYLGLTGKHKWRKFKDVYQQKFFNDGHYPLTYEVIYAHAFAPQHPELFGVNKEVNKIPIQMT